MPLKPVSSTRFGSARISRTSSGVACMSRLVMIELMQTLLPEPVCPAISRWGSFARLVTIGDPATSRPRATVSFDSPDRNSALSATSRSETRPMARFGISIPTTLLPGMGASIRRLRAASPSARSSASDSIRLSLTPAAGLSSYRVTTGPTNTSATVALMPKLARVSSMTRLLRRSSSVPARAAEPSSRSSIEGSAQGLSGGSACNTPSATTAAEARPAIETANGSRAAGTRAPSGGAGSEAGVGAPGASRRAVGIRP